MRISSYPSIYNLGHRCVKEIFDSHVVIQEKVDGSQISFGVYDNGLGDEPYEFRVRSKGAEINTVAPEKMFKQAVDFIASIKDNLHPGWTYRGEYLKSPKHNTLAYDRIPKNHIMLFDIDTGDQQYLDIHAMQVEAERIGLETVPMIFSGKLDDLEQLRTALDRTSALGGCKIEGVVIKNYNMLGPDKKVLMAKFVSEAFKEVHAGEWRKSNPTQNDIIERLITKYTTPARWAKAVQHLREAGQIEDSPRDIGKIMKEIPQDVHKECIVEIADELLKWAWPKISRGLCRGFPEWYKEELLKLQFNREESDETVQSDS